MPVTPTYPGVYIEELPSRVRTITAVSTSVTAFVGHTRRGPLNQPVTITSFADFERRFGGLAPDSAVSYAVQQFFLNGGSIAVVVRVAKAGTAGSSRVALQAAGRDVLELTAREPGKWGDGLRVQVDYDTPTPDQTFNLHVLDLASGSQESHFHLSMDPHGDRYVATLVNSSSALVTAEPLGEAPARPDPSGTVSQPFETVPGADALTKTYEVTVNATKREFTLYDPATDGAAPTALAQLALLLERKLRALPDAPGQRAFSAARVRVSGKQLQVIAGSGDPGHVLTFSPKDGGAPNLGSAVNPPVHALSGGADGEPPGFADLIGNEVDKTGVNALRDVADVNLLCLPEVAGYADLDQMVTVLAQAERLCADKRMFLLVDAPASWRGIDDARAQLTKFDPLGDHAALYFPHLRMVDPLTGRLRAFPPSGAVAGVMARTDAERGVWKAPAGTEARLAGVTALTVPMTDPENGLLNPVAVNCLRIFPVIGPVVWGARTLEGADRAASQWKYVPVRRLALMIEESLYRGTKWVVFEPNDEKLWGQVRLNVGSFMHSLFRQGAFQGTSPREAYFVKCDKDTTTQQDINSGVVNIVVGFAPLKPAEFVIVKIQQMAGQIEV
ncbi:tail protein [Carbonactinospora thermoautotrophica]|uniref:Tail protein n=1 Tax=Carbonactinospora thermoautotrophica TaxID=1469144 RepID=A0A132NIY6_9ACTN|nr:phage tail sheath C-terminal domain-containing protein [Carbonactinospora thermoautotrophica]KWX03337.1 tail protein [Carbonactinospora thermoautotrophica]KWX10080.1 tail protein [Carbonactinospora thermoautotrophica]